MRSETPEAIAGIRYHHRQRIYAMETRKAMDLRLGWLVKMDLGWSRTLSKTERDAIAARAADLVKIGAALTKGKMVDIPGDFARLEDVILATLAARTPFAAIEKAAEKEMARLAQELAVWQWAAPIRGFGPVSLAVIIAEAGDLSNYPTIAKLWTRMMLGLVDGIRQGGLPKTATAAEWIRHGYNKKRRSRMWNIGQALVKGNRDGAYRAVYLARKDYERARAEAAGLTVAPSASIPKDRKDEFMSLGHIDHRAQRVMEKRLLVDLWQAWRETTIEV